MQDALDEVLVSEKVKNTLRQTIGAGHSHAILLSGAPGETRQLAEAVAATLLGTAVTDLVRQPNYLVLVRPVDKKTEEQKAIIPVDDVLDFCARLALSSFGVNKKVAVIEDADALNVQGQNALLKTLEEPKGDTLIILLAEYPDRLLATIRSRAVEIAIAERSATDEVVFAEAAKFLTASRTDRLQQAVALTKGDEAAGASRMQDFLSALALAVHATLLAECAIMPPDTLRAYTKALALLSDAPRALQSHANATLTLEAIALALP